MLRQYGTRRVLILWMLLEAFGAYLWPQRIPFMSTDWRADEATCWCNNTEKRVESGTSSTDLNLHISFSDTNSIFIPLSNHTLSFDFCKGETALTLWYHQKQSEERRVLKRIQLISTYTWHPYATENPTCQHFSQQEYCTKIDHYQAENYIRSFNYNTLTTSDTSS